MKKRYLVTYANRNINTNEAVSLLGVNSEMVKEGVSFMATNTSIEEEDTIHFENMGISSLGLTEEEAEELSEKDGVLAIEEDAEMSIFGYKVDDSVLEESVTTVQNRWNIDMVKAPEAWANGYTGDGVNLAILDTGIATHPDLVISGGVSFVPGVTSYNDGNGHGTHCAGIAAARNGLNGVANDCNLYAVKVLNNAGSGYSSWIIAGMDWCVQNNINVASMSLGGSNPPSIAYANAVKNCEDNGVTVVCASGNGFQTTFPWVASPANSFMIGEPNASPISVGAIDDQQLIANFSSRGTNHRKDWNPVTVVAPGVAIYSTYLNNGYATLSGTSMACPHVAGLAALIFQKNSGINPHNITKIASNTATNLGRSPYPNEAYGHGVIDCDKATT